MAEQEQTTTEATAKEQDKTPVAQAAEPQKSDNSSQEQTVPYARFKEVNDRLKALEDEQSKKAKEREDEENRRLAESQEWQKLADKRKTQVEELMPKADLADKLTALVTQQYQAEIKDWPESVRAMAPSEDASILSKLEWMQKAKPLALELAKDTIPTPGNGRRQQPAGQTQRKEKIEPIYDVRRNF